MLLRLKATVNGPTTMVKIIQDLTCFGPHSLGFLTNSEIDDVRHWLKNTLSYVAQSWFTHDSLKDKAAVV